MSASFSTRLPASLRPNTLARAVAARRTAGRRLLDLTETNPTRVGLPYPGETWSALGDAANATYRPDPRGLVEARRAIAADYATRGLTADAGRLVLTASTSEAYALLFKLLCDPGTDVLVPHPGYPLFDLLTRLEGVEARPYRLEWHGRWSIDRPSLEGALTRRTRAIVIVSPNNPTGSMLRASEREWLIDLSRARDVPLIVDEVFAEYPLAPAADTTRMVGEDRTLVFSLGGLSKSSGLPQLKLAWIVVDGPGRDVAAALDRLDVIADSYLSVSTPVQLAAGALIAAGRTIRAAIAARVARNLASLRDRLGAHPAVRLLDPEAGWSAVLQVPALGSEDALAVRLVDEAGVLAHPGHFYDFERGAYLVLGLLPEPVVFDEAVARLLPIVGAVSV